MAAAKLRKSCGKNYQKQELIISIFNKIDAPNKYQYKVAISTRTAFQILLFLYFIIVLKLTLIRRPINYFMEQLHDNYGLASVKQNIVHSNPVPFNTIIHYFSGVERLEFSIPNLLGNLILFIPFGFILPILNFRFNKLSKIILAALFLSLGIETIQMIGCLGQFDVDDLLLNTLGAGIGYLILFVYRKIKI